MPTLFIDNGAYAIKAFYIHGAVDAAGSSNGGIGALQVPYLVVPNAVGASSSLGRGIVGTTLCTLNQYHSLLLRRPLDQGFLVDGELQAFIWDGVLQHYAIADEADVDVVFTAPHGMPAAVLEQWAATLTTAFSFRSVTVTSAAFLALVGRDALDGMQRAEAEGTSSALPTMGALDMMRGSGVVVDCGYSHTTITPFLQYRPMRASIVRSAVAGKLLTNRLKEVLSFRQVNLLEDTWIVNCIKESCCSVLPKGGPLSMARMYDALHRKKRSRSGEGVTPPNVPSSFAYALPTVPAAMPAGCLALPAQLRGAFRDAQIVKVAHEGFVIPEALFCPADVGLGTEGIVQALDAATSSSRCPGLFANLSVVHTSLRRRMTLFGGTANLPGFHDRLASELIAMSTDECSADSTPQPTASLRTATDPPGMAERVVRITGLPYKKSLKHRQQELLPLVGALMLLLSPHEDAILQDLKRRMLKRGAVLGRFVPTTEGVSPAAAGSASQHRQMVLNRLISVSATML